MSLITCVADQHATFVPGNSYHPVTTVKQLEASTRMAALAAQISLPNFTNHLLSIYKKVFPSGETSHKCYMLLRIGWLLVQGWSCQLLFCRCNFFFLFFRVLFYNIPSGRPRIFCLISEREGKVSVNRKLNLNSDVV